MIQPGGRQLRDGRTVRVYTNRGLRKVCSCPRRVWPKCPHPWHLNYRWRKRDYRFSLDRYAGRHIEMKSEAEALADTIRSEIRSGTFGKVKDIASPEPTQADEAKERSFETVARIFIESTKARGKTSWGDDASMLRTLVAFTPPFPQAIRLGAKPVTSLTEEELEAFLQHLTENGRTVATRNHYIGMLRTLDRWMVRRKYRDIPVLSGESTVIRKRRARKRTRRLERDEERKLLAAAGPHLQQVIVCALETGCRVGEILQIQWKDVSLARREIALPAEKTKTRTARVVPVSARLRAVLEMIRNDPAGEPFEGPEYVFGDGTGRRVKNVKRAWQTAVLKAHGHTPTWTWVKSKARKGTGRLSPESQGAYRAVDLHLHDLRHEAGSRLLEAGWPLHHVQHMLGHANIEQTSIYLNATLKGLHRSMKAMDRTRRAADRRERMSVFKT